MYYTTIYDSPIGQLTLASNEDSVVGLWVEDQKYFGAKLLQEFTEDANAEPLVAAENWLDRYFAGEKPDVSELSLAPVGSEFRQEVWGILREIPYGEVTTYGEIAKTIAGRRGKERMSCQAVGGAVGHNPISIIVPCHRVIGSDGSLTGFASGIDKKIKLLELEGFDLSSTFVPKKGTAL